MTDETREKLINAVAEGLAFGKEPLVAVSRPLCTLRMITPKAGQDFEAPGLVADWTLYFHSLESVQ